MNHESTKRKSITGLLLPGMLLIVASSFSLHAQSKSDSTGPVRFWLNEGMGVGSRLLAANVSINFQRTQFLITIHASADGTIFGETLDDYGLLIGITNRSSEFHFSCSIGIAGVQRTEFDKYLHIHYSSRVVGFPLEIQMYYRPLRFFGIGSSAFLFLSRLGTMLGITASSQFGWFW